MIAAAGGRGDPEVGDLDPTTEVLLFQRWELGIMDTFLDQWNQQRGDLERVSMQWMDMGTPVSAMPGMASTTQLDELKSAGGSDADRLFLPAHRRKAHRPPARRKPFSIRAGPLRRIRWTLTHRATPSPLS